MLFAAGFGTRMGALTATRPKPLIEVGGRSLLDRALDVTQAPGITRRVVNAHYRAEMIEERLKGRDIVLSREAPEILETGGGLKAALPHLGSPAAPVFTLNTDAVWSGPNPLITLRAAWRPADMDALLLLIPTGQATGHGGTGDFARGPDGRLCRGGPLVYTGAQILRPGGLLDIPDRAFSLNRLWDAMLAQGRLYGAIHSGGWCDVGHPEGIALAEAMLETA